MLTLSKAERGYQLAAGTPFSPSKASARGFVEAMSGAETSSAALRSIIGHGAQVLLANAEVLHATRNPEAVHQARVALRRMRSALRLLDRGCEDFPPGLASELRWAGQCMGGARDWDVLVDTTLPALLSAAPAAAAAALKHVMVHAAGQRAEEHRNVLVAIGGARFARLALRLLEWTLSTPEKGRRLDRITSRVLGKAHHRLFEAARFFSVLSVERRHRVRILAKRLRYALDVMSPMLPGEAAARYLKALAAVQEVLGELNDLAVAGQRLHPLWRSQSDRQQVTALLSVREAALVRAAEAELAALYELNVPWNADSASAARRQRPKQSGRR
jgi:CHAD domain-containing protein